MRLSFLLALLTTTVSINAFSSPWVNTDNIRLRADIQLLADSGVINVPVTTYPLMWESISSSLENINIQNLSAIQQSALNHVKQRLLIETGRRARTKFSIYASNENRQFTSFGHDNYEKGKVEISYEKMSNDWAGKLQVNYNIDSERPLGDDQTNFDDSFIAYKLGNWVVNAGAIDQWWGPGMDTSLIMSNNARPLPALAVRRNDSAAFDSPWLSWLGPWTFSAQMAQLEEERFIPNAKMWSSRATFKPYRKIELGISWSYQWGGKGQPNSIRQFFRGLRGETECVNGAASCDESLQTKLGNQLAGFDARWSDSINGIPYAIYTQRIGEDSPSPGTLQISDRSYLYGIETQFGFQQQRILANIEYSDTQANCGADGDTSQDCFYEHGLYQSGYRFYRRSIGSTYDNDAETLVLTLLGQQVNNNSWQVKFRNIDLNTNNRDRFPSDPHLGNTVSKIAQQLNQIEMEYQFEFLKGRMTVGGLYTDTKSEQMTDSEFDLYLKFDYTINQ